MRKKKRFARKQTSTHEINKWKVCQLFMINYVRKITRINFMSWKILRVHILANLEENRSIQQERGSQLQEIWTRNYEMKTKFSTHPKYKNH